MVDIKKSAIEGLINKMAEFSHIAQFVFYLLQKFRTFLKWYHFCFIFSHFARIDSFQSHFLHSVLADFLLAFAFFLLLLFWPRASSLIQKYKGN